MPVASEPTTPSTAGDHTRLERPLHRMGSSSQLVPEEPMPVASEPTTPSTAGGLTQLDRPARQVASSSLWPPDGSTPAGCVPTRASPAGVMPTQFPRPTMCVSSHDRRETRKAGDRSGNYDLEAAVPNSSRAALRPDTLSGSPDIIRVSSATLPSPLTSLTDAEAPWRSITQC